MGLQIQRSPSRIRWKAIIYIEIWIPTVRTEIPEKENAEAVAKDLDTTDEHQEAATVRMASYQQRLTNLHNRRVNPHTFLLGELVLRRVFENTTSSADGKLQLKLEGLYTVVRVGITGSYALSKPDGIAVPRTWKTMHLKKYYQ